MITKKLRLTQIAGITLTRVWLVFSFVLVLGVATSSVFYGENPLSSDNPHIFGFLFAFVAAGLAFIYSVADCCSPLIRRKHLIVAAALVLWCLFFAVGELFVDGEGDGWPMFIAVGSLIAGLSEWFLCAIRLPTWVRVTISITGLASALLYGYVAIKMNSMSQMNYVAFNTIG